MKMFYWVTLSLIGVKVFLFISKPFRPTDDRNISIGNRFGSESGSRKLKSMVNKRVKVLRSSPHYFLNYVNR